MIISHPFSTYDVSEDYGKSIKYLNPKKNLVIHTNYMKLLIEFEMKFYIERI